MNEKQFDRALRSVGMSCFVDYFDLFSSNLSREDVVERLKSETRFTEKSCNSRASHARSIIRNGYTEQALIRVVEANSKRVNDNTRNSAKAYLNSLFEQG